MNFEHLGLFVACFGIRLLIINFKFYFNLPSILNNFQFSPPSPSLRLAQKSQKILSDLWELAF